MSKAKGAPFRQFFHRSNSDSSVDSIRGDCLLTTATAANEADLRAKELAHRCVPKRESNKSFVAQYER
jgi:hypothetical protein